MSKQKKRSDKNRGLATQDYKINFKLRILSFLLLFADLTQDKFDICLLNIQKFVTFISIKIRFIRKLDGSLKAFSLTLQNKYFSQANIEKIGKAMQLPPGTRQKFISQQPTKLQNFFSIHIYTSLFTQFPFSLIIPIIQKVFSTQFPLKNINYIIHFLNN